MAPTRDSNRHHNGLVAPTVIIAIAVVICAVILSRTVLTVKGYGRTIAVTGAAFKPITSNHAVWSGTIVASAPTLDSAYALVRSGLGETNAFLVQEEFDPADYEVGVVQIRKDFDRNRQLLGYTLRQDITVEMHDVGRITDLARESSTLIERGVEFESGQPRYLFTGLDDLKIEMIRAATENAKLRANELARTTGREVGAPTSARVGVFQIRPLHSQEVSSRGISDVTSIDKEIVSTVHITFLVE